MIPIIAKIFLVKYPFPLNLNQCILLEKTSRVNKNSKFARYKSSEVLGFFTSGIQKYENITIMIKINIAVIYPTTKKLTRFMFGF